MEFISNYSCVLGNLVLASDGEYLTSLSFSKDKIYEEKELPIFELTKKWLDIYFSGKNPNFYLPLKVNSTPFRKEVCEIMLSIPYGKTMTYKEIGEIIAKRHHKKMSAQAVGQAVGHNPIGIIIPCHRVIGSNNSLIGYAGGLDKKITLLKLEGIDVSKLTIPSNK